MSRGSAGLARAFTILPIAVLLAFAPGELLAQGASKRRGYRSPSDPDRVERRDPPPLAPKPAEPEKTDPDALDPDALDPDAFDFDPAGIDFDVDEVAVEEEPMLEVHGRVATTLQGAFRDDLAEGLDPLSLDFSSAALTLFWDPLDWLRLLAEVEANGEGEVEIDTLAAELRPGPSLPRLRIGYTYVPFGIERFTYAPPRNPFINRPLAFRRVFPGSLQDLGLFVSGELRLPMMPRLSYEASLSSGLRGPDRDDRPEIALGDTPFSGRNKDLQTAGRLGITLYENLDDARRLPLTLELGGSFLTVNYDRQERRRLSLQGFDVRLQVGGLSIQAELVSGSVDPIKAGEATRKRRGAYLWLVYRRRFDEPFLEAAHVGLRLGAVDTDHRRRDEGDLARASLVFGFEPAPGFLFKAQIDQVRELARRGRDRFLALIELGYSF